MAIKIHAKLTYGLALSPTRAIFQKAPKPHDFCNDLGETATAHEHKNMNKSATISLAEGNEN